MRYEMQICKVSSTYCDSWTEYMDTPEVTAQPQATAHALDVIRNFNDTLREGETARELTGCKLLPFDAYQCDIELLENEVESLEADRKTLLQHIDGGEDGEYSD